MLSRLGVPAAAVDVVLALLLCAFSVLESFDTGIDDGTRVGTAWANAVFGVLLALLLLLRQTRPLAAYVAMMVLLAVPVALVPHTLFAIGGLVPVVLLTWSVARHRDGWAARLAWLPPTVVPIVTLPGDHGFVAVGDLLIRIVFLAGAVVVARTTRRFETQGAALRHTLAALADERAARERDVVEAERARIAVEMQDVVAHAVSLMVVQVGATRMEGGPDEEMAKLQRAESTGRQALAELRTTLGLLRGGDASGDDTTLRPLPGLGDVGSLVDHLRAAGLDVTLSAQVTEPVSESAGLTAYRILQEALTNALKHGGPGKTAASVVADREGVSIRVDSPLGAAGLRLPPGGHGLTGMRERVMLFDGSLVAGPDGDRFVVAAVLRLAPEPVGGR